ncbi:MAG TPA: methyltransferase [Pyrinomonadaceae bacterium]|nr:methyltransferase [Pyrinomonadaceae bacterium]
MNLTFRNVFLNLVYYGLTVVLLPWILLSLESSFGYTRHSVFGMRAGSALIGVVGVALQLWCIVLFQSVGKGTPSPAFAPIKLVRQGPYGIIRNPMNTGELMVFLALCGWFDSPVLLAYSLAAALAFHLFIVFWEEPRHLRRFGERYVEYRRNVGRWWPMRWRAAWAS